VLREKQKVKAMAPPARHRPTTPSTPDDESAVRERSTPTASPPSSPHSAAATRDRLEAKLRTARNVLAKLPATDDRARLLHVAIMRRDEALLDGVLAALGVTPEGSPPSR
jgi:hypothetical protein